MGKKIFIDGGAYDGESVKFFKKRFTDWGEYDIYSFECNPIFEKDYQEDNINFIKNAIWIEDTNMNFYRCSDKDYQWGSSLLVDKTSGALDKENPTIVEAIDFSKWLIDNFSEDDYIVLKLDIEGAEYKVLDKMITDGSIKYIDELHGEWHYLKIDIDEEEHYKLVSKLKSVGLKMQGWEVGQTHTQNKPRIAPGGRRP